MNLANAPLQTTFARLKHFFCNRSSAIFPVRLRSETDLNIVFFNYWLHKNKIENVQANLRVYNEKGELAHRETWRVRDEHTEVSIRSRLGPADFDGMAEIEFVSLDNLSFPFPATIGFYRSGERFSAVHSAGRIRNVEEAKIDTPSMETNWTCQIADGVDPFFHVFNGPRRRDSFRVKVRLFDERSTLLREKEIDADLCAPFASRMFFLSEVFDLQGLPQETFLSVEVPSAEVYTRLIVGTYYKKDAFLEVTHSYPWGKGRDVVSPPTEETARSLASLALPQPPGLKAVAKTFPTFVTQEKVTGKIRRQKAGELHLGPVLEDREWMGSGPEGRVGRMEAHESDSLVVADFVEGEVPARVNTAYRYSVRGSHAPDTTDINFSARTWFQPDKFSHWGAGLLSREYETVVTLTNVALLQKNLGPCEVSFKLYGPRGLLVERKIMIGPESVEFVHLKELAPELAQSAKAQSVSWFAKASGPTLETVWISFTQDGRICGDHGF